MILLRNVSLLLALFIVSACGEDFSSDIFHQESQNEIKLTLYEEAMQLIENESLDMYSILAKVEWQTFDFKKKEKF